ncbi:hypothetical protein D3C76_1552870 [compost metagenome]
MIDSPAGVKQVELWAVHQVLDNGKIVGDHGQVEALGQLASDLEAGGTCVQIDHLAIFDQLGGIFADGPFLPMVQLGLLFVGQLLA